MKLSKLECSSSTWISIRRLLEERLAVLRAKNDLASFDKVLRNQGAIAEIKKLLQADKEDQDVYDEREAPKQLY